MDDEPDQGRQNGFLQYVGQMPGQGTGSPVVFLRHLRRWVSAGGAVRVLAGHGEDSRDCDDEGWEVLQLVHRRWWWPPFRPGLPVLERVRRHLWLRELLRHSRPQVMLVYVGLHDALLPEIAADWAEALGILWVAVIHDDVRVFVAGEGGAVAAARRDRVLRRASVRAYASPELRTAIELDDSWPGRSIQLPPIGQGFAGDRANWRCDWASRPHWVYAGKVASAQWTELEAWAQALQAVGGVLEVVTDAHAPAEFAGVIRAPWRDNAAALQHVARATAFLSVYPDTSVMPWVATSFPSKVIEFAATGVPAVVVAGRDTAIAGAALRCGYPGLVQPGDGQARERVVRQLMQEAVWRRWSGATLDWWTREWEPARVHAILHDALTEVRR